MMIHNNYPSIDYNKWLKRLNDTQLNEQTNQKSLKVPKVVKLLQKQKQLNGPSLPVKQHKQHWL